MSASNPSVPPVQLRDLLDGWQLGRINSIRPYEGGSSGSNKYMVEATEGRFLLKGRPLKALSAEQLEFMRVVMAGCADAKWPERRPQHQQWVMQRPERATQSVVFEQRKALFFAYRGV